ncbi:MAG: O-methyltransferase [Bacteroidota bacterium]
MNLTEQKIFDYAEEISSPENEILKQLSRETHLKVMNPIMLTGSIQGKLLQFLSNMIQPQAILEIGTFTGYSAICLAQGLKSEGKLHTIERDPELEEICRKYIALAGFEEKIHLHIGDALQIVPQLNIKFDLIFIDCDKEIYCEVYNLVFDKLKPGGYILADNVLWHGKIFDEHEQNDKETKGIIKFNTHVRNDKRAENFLLPFRDGLMIIKKL